MSLLAPEPKEPAVPTRRRQRWTFEVHTPSAILVGTTFLIMLGIVFYVARRTREEPGSISPERAARIPDRVSVCKTGPWGALEYVESYIEAPEEFLPTAHLETNVVRWVFPRHSPDEVRSIIKQLPASSGLQEKMADPANWLTTTNGITILPSPEMIIALPPEARRKLYNYLIRFSENHLDPFGIPAASFDRQFENVAIPRRIVELTRQLSYPSGKLLMFWDAPTLGAMMPGYHERIAYFKALSRRPTLFLRLHVLPDSKVDALATYWTRGNWGMDVRPVLDSLKLVPGGARIDVQTLFPPNPSGLLYTYPRPPSNDQQARQDCHWTSMNFFRDPPDARFTDPNYVGEVLGREYYLIYGNPRYGDLVCLTRPNGDMIHSAVFIADDIVYTKNGAHYIQPWMLMRIRDLVETFSVLVPAEEEIRIVYFRSKVF